MVGQVGAGTGIIGLLGFPGDQAVFDVDLPATGTGAVDAVCGSNDFVVLPALSISVFPGTRLIAYLTVAIGKLACFLFKELQSVNKVAHILSPRKQLGVVKLCVFAQVKPPVNKDAHPIK